MNMTDTTETGSETFLATKNSTGDLSEILSSQLAPLQKWQRQPKTIFQ